MIAGGVTVLSVILVGLVGNNSGSALATGSSSLPSWSPWYLRLRLFGRVSGRASTTFAPSTMSDSNRAG
jgi:hypothetical protein